MWLVLALLGSSLACNEICESSCSVLNAPSSCYASCGCDHNPITLPVSLASAKSVSEWQFALAKKTGCEFSNFQSCAAIECPYKYFTCVTEHNCQSLLDFKIIVENIPSELWQAVQPRFLENLFNTVEGSKLFGRFMECNAWCFEGAAEKGVGSDEFFGMYENCNKVICSAGFLEAKRECVQDWRHDGQRCGVWKQFQIDGVKELMESCSNQCDWNCYTSGATDGQCYNDCVSNECENDNVPTSCQDDCDSFCKNDQPFVEGCYDTCVGYCDAQVEKNVYNVKCLDMCKAGDLACLKSCSLHYKGNEKDLYAKKPKSHEQPKGSLGDICYQECSAENLLDRACFVNCLNEVKPTKQMLQAAPEDRLTAVPVNCGQICFQTCYTNFQLTPGCYYPCMQSCTTVSSLNEPSHKLQSEAYESTIAVLLQRKTEALSTP